MKKIVIILFFCLISVLNLYNQDLPKSNYKPYLSPEELIKEKQMKKPMVRIEEFMRRRAYPYDKVPDGARLYAIRKMESMIYGKSQKAVLLAQQPVWRPIGPYTTGGRIKSIAPDPVTTGVVYAGAAAGGIWKTTDAGQNWTPIFDFENAIAFGSIAIDPNNPDIIYAGTGEAVSGAGAGKNGGTPIYLGGGIFKSTDAGVTWKISGLTTVGTFSKVIVHPKNSKLIYAGAAYTGEGLYKSTDAGETWEKLTSSNITDVTVDPTDENRLFVGVMNDGVYYSSDGGKTLTNRSTGIDAGVGRISVQLAPSKPDVLYMLTEISSTGRIFKSTNAGGSWFSCLSGGDSFFNGQSWYDNYICVSPTNENIVFAGGIDTWLTQNGGADWTNVTQGYSGGNVHVDQHCAAFNPLDPRMVYIGNDGGIYKSVNGGQSWSSVNNNLQVTQFYSLAIDNSKVNRNYGGTQDNGTLGNISQDNWQNIIGGDGFRVIVDPNNPNIVYGESQYGNMQKLNISNWTYKSITAGIPSSDQGLFDSPFIMDPVDNSILFHGRHGLYISGDAGGSWDAIITARENQFTSIAASALDDLIIYAGTTVGELFVCTDGGEKGNASWKEVSQNGLVNRFLTDIEPSYFNNNTVYVTFSGYGTAHVFKSTDLGQSWKNIGAGLPDVPVNAITLHPDNENWLFIATDVGVFATFDDGANWLPFGRSLPRTPVHDIAFHTDRSVLPNLTLRVATHGRSMWEVEVPTDKVLDPEITSPVGGEVWGGGSQAVISWYGLEGKSIRIDYSTDDGINWNKIVEGYNKSIYNWQIPNFNSYLCRIKISVEGGTANGKSDDIQGGQTLISRLFTIRYLEKGAVLKTSGVKFVPYGVAFDGKHGLWTTSFYGNKLYKLNADNFEIERILTLPGDSLFTDLSYDKVNNIMYIHHMYNTSGSGGAEIIVIDTNGNKTSEHKSPAPSYPIGIELVDDNLVIGDRDGSRNLYVYNYKTFSTVKTVKNPYQKTYGPRGLCYDGKQYLYQVCTEFPNGGSLNESLIMKIDKNDMTKVADRLPLESRSGIINGRGIDYDPRDETFWITDFGGNIYKIAGFNIEGIIGVQDEIGSSSTIDVRIFPNPVTDFGTITFKNFVNNANVNVTVFDVLGRIVATPVEKQMNSGDADYFQISADNLSDGIYNIVFKVNGKIVLSKQLVIAK